MSGVGLWGSSPAVLLASTLRHLQGQRQMLGWKGSTERKAKTFRLSGVPCLRNDLHKVRFVSDISDICGRKDRMGSEQLQEFSTGNGKSTYPPKEA